VAAVSRHEKFTLALSAVIVFDLLVVLRWVLQ
jgi:hypothetical protein